jgi:hypothetical protein
MIPPWLALCALCAFCVWEQFSRSSGVFFLPLPWPPQEKDKDREKAQEGGRDGEAPAAEELPLPQSVEPRSKRGSTRSVPVHEVRSCDTVGRPTGKWTDVPFLHEAPCS